MLTDVVSLTMPRTLATRGEERRSKRERLDRTDEAGPTILPHPTLQERFDTRVASLSASLPNPGNRPEVAASPAKLIKEVVIRPAGDTGGAEPDTTSSTAKLISFANDESRLPQDVGQQ